MGWHEAYIRNFRLVTQIASHPGECFLDCSSYRFYRVLSSWWSCRRIILRYEQPLATVFTMNAWKNDMICIYIYIYDTYVTNIFTCKNICRMGRWNWHERWRESELWGPHAKGAHKILCDAPVWVGCLFDIFVAKPSGLSFDDTRIKFSKSYWKCLKILNS